MTTKLTDKQKARLWEQTRSPNFQASSRLEDIKVEIITLEAAIVAGQIAALRRAYE